MSFSLALPLHLAAILSLLGVAAFAPPPSGEMLLIPLPGGGPVAVAARDAGAALGGMGPVPGSIVVTGERSRLLWPLLRRGILTVSARPLGCFAGSVGS